MKVTKNRVFVLDKVPEYEPEPLYIIDNPDYVAHIDCKGARFHVISYQYANGKTRMVCSCKNCIVNYLEENRGK